MKLNQMFEVAEATIVPAIPAKPNLAVLFPSSLKDRKEIAMHNASLVVGVTEAQDQPAAVSAQRDLKEVIQITEKGFQAEIDKVNAYKRALWSSRDEFLEAARKELDRISKALGDFHALELAKARAAEAARNAELADLERQRAEAMAQANSHEELDQIAEDFNRQAANVPVVEPPRVDGQRITKDWDITITDIWALARAMPACVKLEPLISQIKAIIKAGITKIPGVTWKEITKADVRLGQKQKVIEI